MPRFGDDFSRSKATEAEELLRSIVAPEFDVNPGSFKFAEEIFVIKVVAEVKFVGFKFRETPFSEFLEFWSDSINFSELDAEKISVVVEVNFKFRADAREEIFILGADCPKKQIQPPGDLPLPQHQCLP